jgi:2,3-dihydroxybenzoate decarboxylase
MDKCGLDMQVLSLTNPGIQAEKDAKRAVTHARKNNDFLKTLIDKYPTSFGGFAALALKAEILVGRLVPHATHSWRHD